MDKIVIDEIQIDSVRNLLVRPKLPPVENYDLIYRDGHGVQWAKGCLCAREPAKWDLLKLFKQMVAAVRGEYGQQLVITSETKWFNVPTELKNIIELEMRD